MEWKADFDQEEPTSTTSASADAVHDPKKTSTTTMPQEEQQGNSAKKDDAEDPTNSSPVTTSARTDNNHNQDQQEEDLLSKYLFCFASFHAVFAPVCICMILSALAVVYINTDETRAAGQAALSQSYEVFDLEDGNSNQNFWASIGNTLIIIGVICGMTFVVVLLYKFRCMKLFYGYMILVTTMLLGYFTTNILLIVIRKYDIPVDWPSLIYIMYNFAIVGTLAIFYGKGIPTFVTQGYLICTSVVLAWQLSFFGTWTAWTLLVVLALYDLFAVLTPCGPLKKLAELMSEADAPAIPGLLYEAALPNNVQRPKKEAKAPPPSQEQHEHQDETATVNNSSSGDTSDDERKMPARDLSKRKPSTSVSASSNETKANTRLSSQPPARASKPSSVEQTRRSSQEVRYGRIPVSLAMVYKLQILDEEGVLRPKQAKSLFAKKKKGDYQNNNDEVQVEYSGLELRERKDLTPRQLKSVVKVAFPPRGGRIESAQENGKEYWHVYNRHSELMREFVIHDTTGRVYEKGEVGRTTRAMEDQTIKLGLGDFIFYSVLVSKAALEGFISFAVCMLAILVGLCVTLLLLSVYGKALPALPISIFLAVFLFFLSTAIVDPWLSSLIREPLYV